MKKNRSALSIIALIFVLILGGFLVYGYYQKATYKLQRPIVSMEIKDYGTVKIELYPDEAPNTVKNFIKLINEGYYNGLTFHRVEDMLIQGGESEMQDEISIDGEFSENDIENNLKFERGTLGLARESYGYYSYINSDLQKEEYNSGYAQFFITAENVESFNGYYAAFGKVVEGIEIVDKITKLETEEETDKETGKKTKTTKPVKPPVISNITVDTFGVEYGDPQTHETFDVNSYLMQKLYGISY